MASVIYTAEMDARMLELWSQGYTTRQIADSMGLGRLAVLGRLYRLDAAKRVAPGPQGKRQPLKPPIKPAAVRFAERQHYVVAIEIERDAYDAAPFLQENGEPYTIGTVPSFGACRWLAGEPGMNAPLCGHKTVGLEPYCCHHRERSYQKQHAPRVREPKYG